jgi:hypothetical protein
VNWSRRLCNYRARWIFLFKLDLHVFVVPACEPPAVVDGEVAVELGEVAPARLVIGATLVVGGGVFEAWGSLLDGYAPER